MIFSQAIEYAPRELKCITGQNTRCNFSRSMVCSHATKITMKPKICSNEKKIDAVVIKSLLVTVFLSSSDERQNLMS